MIIFLLNTGVSVLDTQFDIRCKIKDDLINLHM